MSKIEMIGLTLIGIILIVFLSGGFR